MEGRRLLTILASHQALDATVKTFHYPSLDALKAQIACYLQRLSRVLDYMNANLAENMSLSQLAALVGLGPVQFARAFRAATCVPPHQFLIGLRVDEARHLLERTRLPVTHIAFRCGFDQPSHFATTFRNRTGLTPSAYRAAPCT